MCFSNVFLDEHDNIIIMINNNMCNILIHFDEKKTPIRSTTTGMRAHSGQIDM